MQWLYGWMYYLRTQRLITTKVQSETSEAALETATRFLASPAILAALKEALLGVQLTPQHL